MKEFHCDTKLVIGYCVLESIKNWKPQRLLVVTDPYFEKNGTAARLAKLSQARETEIFHRVSPDPSVALAAEGTARVKAFAPDMIVALGGGSAIDCAKAMAYFSGSQAKLVVIPTTSGSGSEVTDFAILTHEGVKHPLVDRRLRPWAAILDGDLLTQLPKSLIADAGFDVLAHALEALVAKNATPITDALAKDAFAIAFGLLPASFGGCTDVRLKIHTASAMAGMAFNQAGLGMCHAISHSLGGRFHVPHGRLNAVLLPAVVGCNAYTAGEKYGALARSVGFGGSADTVAVRNLKNGLCRLRRELQLPETLAQAGITPEALRQAMDSVVEAALEDVCCKSNPCKVEGFMIRKVLEEVAGRG